VFLGSCERKRLMFARSQNFATFNSKQIHKQICIGRFTPVAAASV
jgi:hypothetical protein